MRYYLDTNILVFLSKRDHDGLSHDVEALLFGDYANILLTSSVCVQELIHLFQIGRIVPRRGDTLTEIGNFPEWLDDLNIGIVPPAAKHLQTMAALPLPKNHHDPFDRLIIAQSISDRIPIVSSDGKFAEYERYGLRFVYNKRR